jgi:A/G-specific adenine glycosylase
MKTFPFHIIVEWYHTDKRPNLPWREYAGKDKKTLGYMVWLSEIILQQTQVERGAVYFEKLLKKYPNVETLAQTPYEEFFEDYKGLGYYSRAKNMLKAAQMVVAEYN